MSPHAAVVELPPRAIALREGSNLSSQLLPVNYLAAAKEAATVSVNVYDCCGIDLYATVQDLDSSKIDICM